MQRAHYGLSCGAEFRRCRMGASPHAPISTRAPLAARVYDRRGGRVVDCGGLENRWAGNGPGGANPSLSASRREFCERRLSRLSRDTGRRRTRIPATAGQASHRIYTDLPERMDLPRSLGTAVFVGIEVGWGLAARGDDAPAVVVEVSEASARCWMSFILRWKPPVMLWLRVKRRAPNAELTRSAFP